MMADKVLVMLVSLKLKVTNCKRRADRLLCSNLVQISWVGAHRRVRKEVAVVENISKAGLGLALFVGVPLESGTELSILANGLKLSGHVTRCVFREDGYMVGLKLNKRWTFVPDPADRFTPEHLLDVNLLDLG
jgi:hypothetical protein